MFQRPNYGGFGGPSANPPDVAGPSRSEGGGFFGFGHRRTAPQDAGGLDSRGVNQAQAPLPRVQRPPQRYGEPPARFGQGEQAAAASAQTRGIEFSGWACPQGGEPCVFEEYTYY